MTETCKYHTLHKQEIEDLKEDVGTLESDMKGKLSVRIVALIISVGIISIGGGFGILFNQGKVMSDKLDTFQTEFRDFMATAPPDHVHTPEGIVRKNHR